MNTLRSAQLVLFALVVGVGSAQGNVSGEIVSGEIAERIDAYLGTLAEGGFAGAALIARDGEVILSRGYGLADRENGIAISPTTVFTTGSITKQFTAAAILKLEQEGKLSVHDSIARHLDGVPAAKSEITLHQLLTHSSGLPVAIGDDFEPISREAYLSRAMLAPLESAPGEVYRYSNLGYSLLAAIVERVSGQPYEHYLREALFDPAGMHHTGYLLPDWQGQVLARGYLASGEDWGTLLDRYGAGDEPLWNLWGNGGILSTATDMHRWHRALQDDRVLSEAQRDKLFTPYVSEGGGSYYGYGWSIVDTPNGTLVTHNGGNGVFHADLLRFVDADVLIYVSSSAGEPDATRLGRQLARMVFDDSYDPLEPGTRLDPESLATIPQGRHALAVLEILAGADEAQLAAFVSERVSPTLLSQMSETELMNAIRTAQQEIGASELRGAVQRRDTLELELITAGGDPATLILGFEDEAPHRIVGIMFVD